MKRIINTLLFMFAAITMMANAQRIICVICLFMIRMV